MQGQFKMSKGMVTTAIFVVLAILFAIFVAKSIRTVDTKCVAVITLFGEVTGQEDVEGLHLFQNPFCKFNIMSIALQSVDIDTTAFSAENQDVMCGINVNYAVKIEKAIETFRDLREDPKRWDSFILPIVENAFKELTISYKITEIVSRREELRQKTMELVAKRMVEQGDFFVIKRIEITNMDYGAKYKDQIGERNKMTQQALQAEEQLKKEKMLAQIPVIQAQAKVESAVAEAEATIVRAKAEAEAFKIISESITGMNIILEAIKKWNGILPFGRKSDKEEE